MRIVGYAIGEIMVLGAEAQHLPCYQVMGGANIAQKGEPISPLASLAHLSSRLSQNGRVVPQHGPPDHLDRCRPLPHELIVELPQLVRRALLRDEDVVG